jgi:probable F420-dependent oxidoreductase
MELGSIGIWSAGLRTADSGAVVEAAAELEELGYGTLWFPAREHAGLADRIQALLEGTKRVVVATGIINVWTHSATDVAAEHHALETAFPGRFLLGLGVGHPHAVPEYTRPLQKMQRYLDDLDAASPPVPKQERALAALGPKMLDLSGARSLGTHPYFVPPAHTRIARERLGQAALVAPEQMMVLDTDPTRARTIARATMARYLNAPNYANNLVRLGYTSADIGDGGSDRLVDDIVAWGDPATALQRVREHLNAGADHVCIQVLSDDRQALSLDAWRRLAKAWTAYR